MIRFVVSPDGELVPDLAGDLPGRGLYVTASRARLERALKRGGFARVAGRRGLGRLTVPADLPDRVERLLAGRAVTLLGLANRAGQVVAGRDKVAGWLRDGRVALLIQARDGSETERARTAALAPEVPVASLLDGGELAQVFGRSAPVVEVAVADGGLARRLRLEMERLRGFRAGLDAAIAPKDDMGDTVGDAVAS